MTNSNGLKPRQFTLRFLFMLTALSVGQLLIMRLQATWQGPFILYVFVVGVILGIAFSTERGGPGSFCYALLWTAVSVAGAWLGLLRDGGDAEMAWKSLILISCVAFWGDVIGGASAWCWRTVTRNLNLGLDRRPREPRED